jgi:hypothetical protein
MAGTLQFAKHPAARCIVTLFIFDDMTKNVQIAFLRIPQSTVRKPQFFIIKTDRIRVIYEMGTKLCMLNEENSYNL